MRSRKTPAASRQIALLRGVNVGRAKRVAMAELRAVVEGLGYGDVRTLRNSGNVLFTAAEATAGVAGARIEEAVAVRLGVEARVLVVGADELATIVAENPLADESRDPARLLVAFLADPADRRALAAIRPRAPEALAVGSRAAYVWCPEGVLACRTLAEVQRAVGDRITTRNWATVLDLQALAGSG